jgi:divalent metal cation (Fe/Co/Zn/Cd) transporter
MYLEESGSDRQREYSSHMKNAWPWLAGGLLAIGIGLAVWFTAFVLVPAGAVMIAVGIMKLARSRTAASPHSN